MFSTGSGIFNDLLHGGFEEGIITTVYGPSGSGKTNICIFAAVEAARNGKKAVFIDCEGGFSIERLKQITPKYEKIMENILVLQPTTFAEQKKIFLKLGAMVKQNVGLVIVDTIGMLYRLELSSKEDISGTNIELGRQIAMLNAIARKNKIPVLVSNQVYTAFDARDKIQLVGGDIVKYGSKCLIELQLTSTRKRKAILRKHRSIAEDNEIYFEIQNSALVPAAHRTFRLF